MAGPGDADVGDVKKLALFFESLGTSSPTPATSGTRNRKPCRGPGGSDSYTGYTPMIVRPSQFIESVDAVPSDCCIDSSVRPCYICYKVHHYSYCPYFDYLPKGASFNPGFQIVCECGGDFFEDDWVCSNCGVGRPLLQNKYCSICDSQNHCDYECPKDKVLAAEYKLIRDNMRTSCVRIPYKPDNAAESSRMI